MGCKKIVEPKKVKIKVEKDGKQSEYEIDESAFNQISDVFK